MLSEQNMILGNLKDDDSWPRWVRSAWRVKVPLAASEARRARAVAVDQDATASAAITAMKTIFFIFPPPTEVVLQ